MFAPRQAHGWTIPGPAASAGPASGFSLKAPATTEGACTVDTVTDYAAFVAMEREWNDAVARAAVPHPFLRHEWVRTWWDCFGGRASLYILVVRASGRIVGIAPLLREAAQMYHLPTRRVRFLQNDHTPRTDVIIVERPADVVDAIWRELRREDNRWDVLQLSQLPKASPTHELVSRLAAADGCSTGIWQSSDSPYLELAGSWESYFTALPAKFRSNVRNRLSRLAKVGDVALEVLTSAGAIRAAAADAWRLEASGWKAREGTAITSDPAVHRFYGDLIDRGAAAGWLQLLFLTVGGRRIATSYGAVFQNRIFLFKTGYDPEFATGSPFKVLTYFAIQRAYAEGLQELDFLGDSEPWKLEWTATARSHDWLYVFADNRWAHLLHSLKFQWVPGLRRLRA